MYHWVEEYLFFPTLIQRVVSIALLPFTLIYCIVVLSKRFFAKKIDFGLPIISVGNLVVGGSGKTPITIALAKDKDNIAIILRGYKRESQGLIVVSKNGEILTDVKSSGDEAMLLAQSLPKASVIVSGDRVEAISKAKELGAELIFLDDGFSKAFIKKFDILIKPDPQPTNIFCLPSGGYREPRFLYSFANLVIDEKRDFIRDVKITNHTENMVLVTAISKPKRLEKYIKSDMQKYYFADHYSFSKDELVSIIDKHSATSILVTTKDYVKIKEFDLNVSILELEVNINSSVVEKVDNYINSFKR
jgi:tetraacyldisaccharide 4'-kinase